MHITRSVLFIPQIIFELLNKICSLTVTAVAPALLHCVPSLLTSKTLLHSATVVFIGFVEFSEQKLILLKIQVCWDVELCPPVNSYLT
jgi:hypothetical protein